MWEARTGEPVTGEPLTGNVVGIDQGLAQVLIGDAEEEWFFPLTTLPPRTALGDRLLMVKTDGRYQAVKRVASAEANAERSIEDRLSRRLIRDHIPLARQASATGQRHEPQPERTRSAAPTATRRSA